MASSILPQKRLAWLSSCVCSRAILSKTLNPHPHECLKDVEIFGFVERKLVMYLLEIAINLEKITIDPYHPSEIHRTSKKKEEAKKRAHRLRKKLPSRVKLSVL